MNAREYLKFINRNELVKVVTGRKTGEFVITPKEMEGFAEHRELEAFRAGFRAGETAEAFDTETTVDVEFKAWKGQRP